MKKNTQALALMMFPLFEGQAAFMTTSIAQKIVPSTTSGGVRSVLHHLSKSGLFFQEKIAQEVRYYLTDEGASQLTSLFPALDARWDTYTGEWECIVFQEAPVGDPQFRYLRTQLIAEHALQLSRGVYCVPGLLSHALSALCKKMYRESVTLFSVVSWKLGFERSTVIRNFSLGDVATAYSSISKEVNQLLAVFTDTGRLTDQQKKAFLSAFDRFRDTLADDVGVVAYYYPNAVTARSLLAQFQHVFFEFLRD